MKTFAEELLQEGERAGLQKGLAKGREEGERRGLTKGRQEGRRERLTKIYNRFHDRSERSADISELRRLHVAMDNAVAATYG